MRRALLPAAWLALSGAAAPQPADALRDLAECRLAPEAVGPAVAALRIDAAHEAEDGPRHRIVRNYALPGGMTIFGLPAAALGSLETLEDGTRRIMIITSVERPYAEVKAAALAGHGQAKCEAEARRDYTTCQVFAIKKAESRTSLLIGENGDTTDIACTYEPIR
ncbi:hypothetical protein OF829_12060 [Sphingomonas sp. LB-2]|uniref:hypothetical protein n=1 Tax=Sphingomonas caeni TaxID=2984949 RepID=UPI002231D4F6|nr:hypothetical protein [Sphingomonas caeni]MCW3847974.1 hypothetical protein [Sphingomonas caeni]